MAAVFSEGSMQEISGKKVEVKTSTPKGSGPVGRGPGLLAGRGLSLGPGATYGPAYGMGPPGYPMPAGEQRLSKGVTCSCT